MAENAKDRKPQYREMALRDIKVDHALQSRVKTNMAIVQEYAEAMSGGSVFPPVVVFVDGDANLLADGFHRFEARKQLGQDTIAVDLREGSRREAMIFSAGANAKMGHRPSREDMKKAVRMLLDDPDVLATWSDRGVAFHCGISVSAAANWRNEYCISRGIPVDRRVSGKAEKETERSHYVPRFYENKKRGHAYFSYRRRNIYLGCSGEEARKKYNDQKERLIREIDEEERAKAKAAEIVADIDKEKRVRLADGGPNLMDWLRRRGLDAKRCDTPFTLFSLPSCVFIARDQFEGDGLLESIGRILVGRRLVGDELRAIIVCYPDALKWKFNTQNARNTTIVGAAEELGVQFQTPEELAAIAGQLGVEFMTPESLCAEMVPKDRAATSGNDPQHQINSVVKKSRSDHDIATLIKIIQRNPTAGPKELCCLYTEKTGIPLSEGNCAQYRERFEREGCVPLRPPRVWTGSAPKFDVAVLDRLIRANPDATAPQLQKRYEDETGKPIGRSAVIKLRLKVRRDANLPPISQGRKPEFSAEILDRLLVEHPNDSATQIASKYHSATGQAIGRSVAWERRRKLREAASRRIAEAATSAESPPTPAIANPDINPLDFDRLVMKKAVEHGADRRAVKDSDQYSDGMMALLEAKARFDPTQEGASFPAYAAACIEGAIKNGLRKRRLGTQSGSITCSRFTDMADPEDPESSDFAASVADDAREIEAGTEAEADRLLTLLNVQERRLVRRCVMEGWSLDRAGEDEDPPLERDRVREIVDGAVAKMQDRAGDRDSA